MPTVQISTALHKDAQDMPTFDHVWKFIQSGGCMNTEYMDVRRGEIMSEFNRYVLCAVLVAKATTDQRHKTTEHRLNCPI